MYLDAKILLDITKVVKSNSTVTSVTLYLAYTQENKFFLQIMIV